MLLRDALGQSDRVAIVKIALRQRESLATLRIRDDVLVLETMIWPDEVRQPDFGFLDEDVAVRPQELAMAESLIDSMAGDFDPAQYSDDYRDALEQVIQAKVSGRELVEPAEREDQQSAGVVDLMAALRASVERAQQSRAEVAEEAPARARKATPESTPKAAPAAKKSAGKKQPAKKAAKDAVATSAKKAAGKKAATRRSA